MPPVIPIEEPIHQQETCPNCYASIPHDPRRKHTKKDCHDLMARRVEYATTQIRNLNNKKRVIEDEIAKHQIEFTKWKSKMQEMGWV